MTDARAPAFVPFLGSWRAAATAAAVPLTPPAQPQPQQAPPAQPQQAPQLMELPPGAIQVFDALPTGVSSNLCAMCGERLKAGSYYDLGDGARAHIECFCCARCQAPLTSFTRIAGDFLCPDCAKKERPPLVCAACKKPVSRDAAPGSLEEGVVALGAGWHRGCLCCAHCRRRLDDGFVELHGQPYCPPSVAPCCRIVQGKLCCVCGRVLGASHLVVCGRNYHRACFCCGSCGAPFPTLEYYMLREQPYCETCAAHNIPAQLNAAAQAQQLTASATATPTQT